MFVYSMSKPREYTLCECTGERATDRGMNIAQSMTGTFLTLKKEMFPEGTITSVLRAIGHTRSGTAQILIIWNYITINPTQKMVKIRKTISSSYAPFVMMKAWVLCVFRV